MGHQAAHVLESITRADLTDLGAQSGSERDPGADPVAVADRSTEVQTKPVVRIARIHLQSILADHIQGTVIVDISNGSVPR